MVFSLIFNVPFYYELSKAKNNNNSRLENIANIFNVQDREILSNEVPTENLIDWDFVNKTIETYRNNSKEILFRTLESLQ